MYEYLNRSIQEGDIVERIDNSISDGMVKGNIYIVNKIIDNFYITILKKGINKSTAYGKKHFKVIKTKPILEARIGDIVIRTPIKSHFSYNNQHIVGKIEIIKNIISNTIQTAESVICYKDCKILCKKEKHSIPKIGDKVIALIPIRLDNNYYIKKGTVETITKVSKYDFNKVCISNTNISFWSLGNYWELYDDYCKKEFLKTGKIINKNIYENLCKEIIVPTTNYEQETLYTNNRRESLKNQNKGSCMSKVTIEVDASCIKQPKPIKIKTDLENAKNMVVEIFDSDGNKYNTTKYKTKKQVKKLLQNPSYLGYTFRCYKLDSVLTTKVPIVETKE